jgi:hypothetical protein
MTTDRHIVTIPAADLPNRALDVSYTEPTYGDYRKAKRLYPYPTREGEVRPSYSVEELLFASMLTKVESKGKELPIEPQDLPSRIEPFPIDDRQAMMLEFIGYHFLDEDQSKAAKAFAMEQRAGAIKPSLLIPGSITPSGRSFLLNRPNTGTQWKADNVFKGPQENGCTLDEMLVAMCLAEINSKPVASDLKDIVSIFDAERIDEVQFLATIFINAFVLDSDSADEAKARGKRKKAELGKKKPVSKKADTVTQVAITPPIL